MSSASVRALRTVAPLRRFEAELIDTVTRPGTPTVSGRGVTSRLA
jgi:hypothetical protein